VKGGETGEKEREKERRGEGRQKSRLAMLAHAASATTPPKNSG